ncbi:metallophosphoesterase [Mammaliicoccus sciuri]|uniref:metallophosphoesterase n=1 Tax=Mammaliicoccus sciuri TaxID=1296 RepID=UPI00087802DB|nr:metallophosphoesterase [Mammaliicoccus sciuri]MBG9205693.1 metallophosphoesterase [Mammaliicoccus sciuri]MCP1286008.1 metallophosphoesterase [Mammaliicoccus sciuri]MDO0956827.1 metallophosphoesterase [Mammaliicoccus sciuri]MDT0754663.1 metallophosphoesterase [Mammaliicoccus sciuri]MEB7051317.1 metallophosphoesterase [Mammaliicoccus sciuri]
MRIGTISDLHIDRSKDYYPQDFEYILAHEITHLNLDLLLIAGDVSNHYLQTMQFVQNVKRHSKVEVLFIPGNHDYWKKDQEEKSSYEIFEYYKAQPESIIASPYIVNEDWAIVGHSGWYDYSFADQNKFSMERLERRKYYGSTWLDKEHIDWGKSDLEMSRLAAESVKNDLEHVKDKNIILMTHIVTNRKFAVPMPHRIFDYFNAFIGTSDFDKFYEAYPIKYSIMGHVHFRNIIEESGIQYICPCLGYQREWRTTDLATEIKNTIQVIEI